MTVIVDSHLIGSRRRLSVAVAAGANIRYNILSKRQLARLSCLCPVAIYDNGCVGCTHMDQENNDGSVGLKSSFNHLLHSNSHSLKFR